MGGACSLAPAPLGRSRQVNMLGVDECRDDVARDDEVVRALPGLFQPDEHKPLVVGWGGDLIMERDPIPVRVDVFLCRAPKLEIGHAGTGSLGLNGDQPAGLGVLGEDVRGRGAAHRYRRDPSTSGQLCRSKVLPGCASDRLADVCYRHPYSKHARGPPQLDPTPRKKVAVCGWCRVSYRESGQMETPDEIDGIETRNKRAGLDGNG